MIVDIIRMFIPLASEKQIKAKYIERVSSNQKCIRFKPVQNSPSSSGGIPTNHQNSIIENNNQTKYNQLIRDGRSKDGQNDLISTKSIKKYQLDLKRQRISRFSSPADNLKLDPLDQKIRIPFQSNYYTLMQKSNFRLNFDPFKDQVRDWLIDVIQITCSITINHMKNQKFNEKEAKNFASKNILLNVKEFFEKHQFIPLQHRYELMHFINAESHKIFTSISYKYPQNGRNGVSKRLKMQVHKIDNRDSDQYDFLFCHKINIMYREDGDYSEDIMKVINKLVSITGDVFDINDPYQESNYEVFTGVMEYIFDNASSQSADNTAKALGEMIKERKIAKGSDILTELKSASYDYFQNSFARDYEFKKSASIKESSRKVLFGQKIPIGTKSFTDQDIKGQFFKIHHSSILRILTKWAEELRNKFEDTEEVILKRVYKFKDFHGNLMNLEIDLRSKLYEAALQQFHNVEEYLDYLKKENTYMQTLFAEETNIGKYCKNDTKVGVFASKINQTSGQYMFKYINRLIHSLLTIPRLAAQMVKSDRDKFNVSSINLVTLKIGDLMRCKCSTTEKEFIKILSAIEETSIRIPNILKIIRVKNRLQQQNGDVLINLFFANKLECELQLSVNNHVNSSDKSISSFNHYVYELIRAQLGPISELSIIIAQYDPLVGLFCKKEGYAPDLVQSTLQDGEKPKNKDTKLEERIRFKKKINIGRKLELPFICWVCQRLSIFNNPTFFYRNPEQIKRECNDCIMSRLKKNERFEQQQLDYFIKNNFSNPKEQKFFKKHLYQQPYNQLIEKVINNESRRDEMNNSFGFLLNRNQKKPILQFFNAVYQKNSSTVLLGSISKSESITIIDEIQIYQSSKKREDHLKKQFSHYFVLSCRNTKATIEKNSIYLKCSDQKCCSVKMEMGIFVNPKKINNYSYIKKINEDFQNQKATLYLNNIPNAFEKVQEAVSSIKDMHNKWKVTSSIRTIEAFNCNLKNITVITNFAKLCELNISSNPEISSLKGIQSCDKLKILDCKGCNLQNINQVASLTRLQHLNLSQNKNLESIDSLSQLTSIKKIYLNQTKINTLKPLAKCSKLQILDIQECKNVKTLSDINSHFLNHLILVNSGLEEFDLPHESTASLKIIEIYSEEVDNNNSILNQIKAGSKINLMCRNNIEKEKNLGNMISDLTSAIIVRSQAAKIIKDTFFNWRSAS